MRRCTPIGQRLCLAIASVAALSCGGSTPTGPSVLQIAGTWTGTQTLTAVSGGECLNVLYSQFIGGSLPITITISQTGASLSMSYGGCSYSGTAGASSFTLESTATCTQPIQRDYPCQIVDGGGTRDVAFTNETLSGTLSGNSVTINITETDAVLAAGTSRSVGTLTLTFTAQANRIGT